MHDRLTGSCNVLGYEIWVMLLTDSKKKVTLVEYGIKNTRELDELLRSLGKVVNIGLNGGAPLYVYVNQQKGTAFGIQGRVEGDGCLKKGTYVSSILDCIGLMTEVLVSSCGGLEANGWPEVK